MSEIIPRHKASPFERLLLKEANSFSERIYFVADVLILDEDESDDDCWTDYGDDEDFIKIIWGVKHPSNPNCIIMNEEFDLIEENNIVCIELSKFVLSLDKEFKLFKQLRIMQGINEDGWTGYDYFEKRDSTKDEIREMKFNAYLIRETLDNIIDRRLDTFDRRKHLLSCFYKKF